nr:uncharacterized protein LOC109167542 [Ipomoea batatas]
MVAKRIRGGQMRQATRSTDYQRQGSLNQNLSIPDAYMVNNTRFAILNEVGEGESEPPPITNNRAMPNLNTEVSLPRIRTNQNPQGGTEKWPRNGSPNMNVRFISQSQGSGRGTTRGRGNRGSAPRRAAAEAEHTVVRDRIEANRSSARWIFTEPHDDEAMVDD